MVLSLRSDDLTYNPIFQLSTVLRLSVHVKLQSRVTSSGAIVVSSIFFSLGGWGGMGWLISVNGQGLRVVVCGIFVFGWLRVSVLLLVRTVGEGEVGKCWQVKVAEERVFMGHLECTRK